jgi:hypothetical protein
VLVITLKDLLIVAIRLMVGGFHIFQIVNVQIKKNVGNCLKINQFSDKTTERQNDRK